MYFHDMVTPKPR